MDDMNEGSYGTPDSQTSGSIVGRLDVDPEVSLDARLVHMYIMAVRRAGAPLGAYALTKMPWMIEYTRSWMLRAFGGTMNEEPRWPLM